MPIRTDMNFMTGRHTKLKLGMLLGMLLLLFRNTILSYRVILYFFTIFTKLSGTILVKMYTNVGMGLYLSVFICPENCNKSVTK